MSKFIVFNTLSQASNYIKRQRSHYHSDGCGCCWSSTNYSINNNKVMQIDSGESMGDFYIETHVLGRVKKRSMASQAVAQDSEDSISVKYHSMLLWWDNLRALYDQTHAVKSRLCLLFTSVFYLLKTNTMKQLFFIILSIILMLTSVYSLFTVTTNNEIIGSIVAFILSSGLGLVSVLDANYETKHNRL